MIITVILNVIVLCCLVWLYVRAKKKHKKTIEVNSKTENWR